MNTMHLFAGMGGGLLGDLILGHKPIIAVEWNKYCCRVLRKRAEEGWFPDLQVWEGDVRLFDPSEYAERVDCIHAGFPCQDLSSAGNQAGIGSETRSGLYREVIRIIDILRPKRVLLENVTDITYLGLGEVLRDLASLGYDAEWLCLRASDCGATHERDRWWLLAYPNGTRCEERSLSIGVQEKYSRDSGNTWWKTKPSVSGVADDVAYRVDRLKGIGNGQVPLQMALSWKLLNNDLS